MLPVASIAKSAPPWVTSRDGFQDVVVAGVHHVGGAHRTSQLEAFGHPVHHDHPAGSGQLRRQHRGEADRPCAVDDET